MLASRFGSVSYGVTDHFSWVSVQQDFVCVLQVWSLFPPLLWKSYNQISVAFKIRFPVDPLSLCWITRLGSLMWGSEPSQQWENFFAIIVLQFLGCPPGRYGFDFIMTAPLIPSHCSSFSLDMDIFFFSMGSSVLLLMVIQQLVEILVLSQETSAHPSTPPSWTRSLFFVFFFF